jgi:outer membrane protein assembly factor BamB
MMNYSGYSTPMLAEFAGKKQILHLHGKGLSGINLENGQAYWTFPFENGPGVNVCQPILFPDDQVLISTSYGNGSALVKIKQENETWSAEKVWQNFDVMRAKFSSNVLHDGYVYGLDEGMLSCIDPIKGVETWQKKSRQRKYGHGQLLLVGNHLLVMAEDGNLALVEANPQEYKEVWKFPALKENGTKRVWNPPALVDGVAYIRDHTEMVAYKISEDTATNPQPVINQLPTE